MERKIRGLILAISIFFAITVFFNQDAGKSGRVRDFLITETDYQEILSTKNEIDPIHLFNLKMDGYILPYDSETHSYLYTMNPETFDLNQIDIDLSANRDLNYDMGILKKERNEASLYNNEPIELVVYTEENYVTYEIYLTTLPIIQIGLEHPESDERPIGNERQKGKLKLFSNDGAIQINHQVVESDMYINLRGASSKYFPKNQYRINLREFTIGGDEKNRHKSLLGLREDDDYILYAAYNDPEKVRNTFSNNLWYHSMAENNRFNITNGIEGKYVELFIEDRYWGLYTLTHPLDNKQVALDKDNNPIQSEFYYRTISHEPFNFEEFEQSKGEELRLGRFELREKNQPYGSQKQWQPLYDYFKVLKQADAETLGDYLNNHTDIENQIDYYLFLMLLQATDNSS